MSKIFDAKENHPGFQSSETTGVEVTVYHQGKDPILLSSGKTPMEGKTRTDKYPAIATVQTTKALNDAGKFTVTLKPGSVKSMSKILDNVVDDDWVDIHFYSHAQGFHVMRGLVDDVRRRRSTSGSGATSELLTITGTDFQKVWEYTPMWFDRATYENIAGAATLRVVGTPLNQEPDKVVKAYLLGFLEEAGSYGRANWELPKDLPGGSGSFASQLRVDASNDNWYRPKLARRAVNPNFAQTGGSLWQCATEWSDPLFCELFTDLVPQWEEYEPKKWRQTKYAEMNVIYRMKPFPNLTLSPIGRDAPFFKKLRWVTIPRQHIQEDDLGRSGRERFNDFRAGMESQQEFVRSNQDLTRPLWNPNDMRRHGQRMFDVNSKYGATVNDLLSLSEEMRGLVRDWYCLNPYLLNGTLTLGCGRPDIRIGNVVRVPGQSEKDQETFYVESVSHNWGLPRGARTSLGVTRGWVGSDSTYVNMLYEMRKDYLVAPLAQAGATTPGDGSSGDKA